MTWDTDILMKQINIFMTSRSSLFLLYLYMRMFNITNTSNT